MFGFNTKEKEKRMQMMTAITPTSKTSLKQQCLLVAKGNLKEAKELYDYFAEDMQNLPDVDPVPPTWQQSTATTVNGIVNWLKENQGALVQGYQFVQGIIANKGALPLAPAAEPLPPINE